MADGGRRRKGSDGALAAALAAGATVAEGAQAANMSERSAYRRLAEPGFAERVAQAQTATMARALARITTLHDGAIDALEQLLEGEQPASVRCRAVSIVLEARPRLAEHVALEDRLEALEQAVAGGQAPALAVAR